MDWGLRNRLARIFQRDRRTVMLAVDHGYFMGPTTRLEDPRATISPLLPYADAIMLTRGVLRNCVDPDVPIPVVLRVSGGTTILRKDELPNETIMTTVEDAVRLNACAVALSIFVGSEYEHQTLANLARLVDMAIPYGMPVLAVTAVGKELEKRDARYLALACRVAAEFGAHFVKTYFCENFERVAGSCPVPLVIAGGPKLDSDMAVFELVYRAIQEGAAGVDMGRNIWQKDYPIPMIRAIRAIVHENYTPQQAHELLQELRGTSTVQV